MSKEEAVNLAWSWAAKYGLPAVLLVALGYWVLTTHKADLDSERMFIRETLVGLIQENQKAAAANASATQQQTEVMKQLTEEIRRGGEK